MPDDAHPPLTAVAAALAADNDPAAWDYQDARTALRALDTIPVREWAQNVKCPKSPGGAFPCAFGNGMVHPECLLAALAGEGAQRA